MVTAIILAAGRSTRMGNGRNKQFLELLGKPLLWYSLHAFEQCHVVDEIVLVRRPADAGTTEQIVRKHGFRKVVVFVDGGAERQDSVWNGLARTNGEIVAVHDGARPLVTSSLIEATVESARIHGTGIAATKVVDTIKEADENRAISRTVDRTKLWAVQTPQTVRTELLRKAYAAIRQAGLLVTDEAAAVEGIGQPVKLVETPFLNLKVTMPGDLTMAEALLRARG